jgi:beta-phosphoglucomutase-like phosphatase (HAD superfamily)
MGAIAFEDSEAGVTAARLAGMYVVGIGPGSMLNAAHAAFPRLDAFTFDWLLRAGQEHERQAFAPCEMKVSGHEESEC